MCNAAHVALARKFAVRVTNGLREGGAKSLVCGIVAGEVVSLVVSSSVQGSSIPFYRSRDDMEGTCFAEIKREREKQKVFRWVLKRPRFFHKGENPQIRIIM